jgi:NADH:ubiquinone oxidoreductase subunit 2 (subunit N)
MLPYASGNFSSHSLLNVIYIVGDAMSAAVYVPLAKIMDLWGRAEGFAIMTVFATLGMVLMAASNSLPVFCAAYLRLPRGINS